jgi:hypothetical protein
VNRIDPLLRGLRPLAPWALAGVALLVSHDLIWAVQMGPGETLATALRSAGHGYWGAASLGLTALGLLAAAGSALRLVTLGRRARRIGALSSDPPPRIRRVAVTWARLFVVVALGFVLQENLEHGMVHGHLPMAGALIGPEYPLALPVIGAITALAAVVATAVAATERALVTAIVQALLRAARAPRSLFRRPGRLILTRVPPIVGPAAGRGPPRPAAC